MRTVLVASAVSTVNVCSGSASDDAVDNAIQCAQRCVRVCSTAASCFSDAPLAHALAKLGITFMFNRGCASVAAFLGFAAKRKVEVVSGPTDVDSEPAADADMAAE